MAEEDCNISGMSNMTDLATNTEIPLLRDNITPEEIFEKICNELRAVGKKLKSTIHHTKPPNSTSMNVEKTVIPLEITSTLHQKANIINRLTNDIKDFNELDFSRYKNEAIMSLPTMMAEEANSCVKAVETFQRIKSENDDHLKLLTEVDQFLTEMEDTEENPQTGMNELTKIQRKAKQDYKRLRQDLTRVTEILFNDEELSSLMYTLLEDLVKKSQSQSEADEWYEITDDQILPLIMMLHEGGAVVTNPLNPMLIKLIL